MTTNPGTPRILVALDPSEDVSRILAAATSLALALEGEVTLLHVSDREVGEESEAARYRRPGGGANDEGNLLFLSERVRSKGLPCSTSTVIGPPAASIREAARELGAAYLVIGVHHHGVVYETLIGSVARDVLAAAPCPVLAVPLHTSED